MRPRALRSLDRGAPPVSPCPTDSQPPVARAAARAKTRPLSLGCIERACRQVQRKLPRSADLDVVMAEASFDRCAVMGYSHGGAVAQQLARNRPLVVSRLILACTYACNVSTLRERAECGVFLALLRLFGPGTLAKLIMRPSKPSATGAIGLTSEQAAWLQSLLAANGASAMRGAVRGLLTFDSRPWLGEIVAATLVVGGTHDDAVARHHFDTLVGGIPGATGRLVDRAGHTLVWTHTREFADIIGAFRP
jgi:3-oxoadipate enol-lactonase